MTPSLTQIMAEICKIKIMAARESRADSLIKYLFYICLDSGGQREMGTDVRHSSRDEECTAAAAR